MIHCSADPSRMDCYETSAAVLTGAGVRAEFADDPFFSIKNRFKCYWTIDSSQEMIYVKVTANNAYRKRLGSSLYQFNTL